MKFNFSNITPEEFLRDYWQKKPLLLRQAFPSVSKISLAPEELAGLALEEGVDSRLIVEDKQKNSWSVEHGPFTESLFENLPERNWTLLVNGVDALLPEFTSVLDAFAFIPAWRREDIMVSYAVEGGNVGAHVDEFDVFLIQSLGKREWLIGDKPLLEDDFIEGAPLKLLKKFEPAEKFVLEPGDVLYLPPRVAHHGISRSADCMTISVGFRAPSYEELLNSLLSHVFSELPEKRYSDPDLALQQEPGELTQQSIEKVRTILQTLLLEPQKLTRWFGSFVSESKYSADENSIADVSLGELKESLREGARLLRAPGARLLFTKISANQTLLFANGTSREAPLECAKVLTRTSFIEADMALGLLEDGASRDVLLGLIADGILELALEDS